MDFLATPRRRRVLFAGLYFAEGAPIGFIWSCLPALLRSSRVPVGEIASFTALLVLPWTFKFVWAPMIDILRGPRWALRHWIIAAQLLMGLTLAPLLFIEVGSDFRWIAPLLFFHACAAATQDVAVDALAISSVSASERGRINGWMQAGMLTGRGLFGGGALLVISLWSMQAVVLIMLAALTCSVFLVASSRESAVGRAEQRKAERARSVLQAFRRIAAQPGTWLALLFAGTAGAGFKGVGSVAQPFLIDRGLTREEVGWMYALPVIGCMIAGSLLGGRMSDRLGRVRTVTVALVLVVGCVGALAIVAATRDAASMDRPVAEIALLMTVYLGAGLLTAAMYALLMDLTDPRIGATQFSAYMGATNGCEAWAGYASGRLVEMERSPVLHLLPAGFAGYPLAFLAMTGASLLSMLLLPALRPERTTSPHAETHSEPSGGHTDSA